jgi:hypothetical protein
MSEEFFKVSAEQLRQPHGDLAIQVGEKMNEINIHIHHNTFEALHIVCQRQHSRNWNGQRFFCKRFI